jgi:hypothetical protein
MMLEPEWLYQQRDLSNYMVSVRPDGKQVLITSRRGVTTIFDKNGRKLYFFKSELPSGGLTSTKMDNGCIL